MRGFAEVDDTPRRPGDEALAAIDVSPRSAEASPALHSTAHRVRAAALRQLGDATAPRRHAVVSRDRDRARRRGRLRARARRSTLKSALEGDEAAAAESRDLLERLGVEQVARSSTRD